VGRTIFIGVERCIFMERLESALMEVWEALDTAYTRYYVNIAAHRNSPSLFSWHEGALEISKIG
jgi:hypothetical protein